MAIELEKVVEAVILIMVLIVAGYFIYLYATSQKSAFNCLDRGGVNVNPDDSQQVQDHPDTDWNCIRGPIFTFFLPEDQKHLMCCIPETPQAKQKAVQEQKEQRERVEAGTGGSNGGTPGQEKKTEILITLDDSITPLKNGEHLKLDAYRNYTLHKKINNVPENTVCLLRVIEANVPTETPYLFKTPPGKSLELTRVQPEETILPCDDLEKEPSLQMKETQVGHPYKMQIKIYDKKDTWGTSNVDIYKQLRGENTLAQFEIYLDTFSALQISFKPETWAQKIEVTIICKTILCEEITLGTVYPDLTGLDEKRRQEAIQNFKPQEACQDLMKTSLSNRVTKLVHNLPPNTPIDAPNLQPIETSLRPDKIKDKLRKTFMIDALTLKQDLPRQPLQTQLNEYLCLQLRFNSGSQDSKIESEVVTKASEKPILIDAQAPTLARELIRVNYQTPTGDLFGSNGKYDPKLAVSSIFLSIPQGACQDVSGCTSYHYSYTPLQDFTPKNDFIGKVMNELFRTLYAKSVTDADCKPSSSSYTTLQSKLRETTLIPLRQQGLGYVCLYAQDGAGNLGQPILVPYLNPYSSVNNALVS